MAHRDHAVRDPRIDRIDHIARRHGWDPVPIDAPEPEAGHDGVDASAWTRPVTGSNVTVAVASARSTRTGRWSWLTVTSGERGIVDVSDRDGHPVATWGYRTMTDLEQLLTDPSAAVDLVARSRAQ